MAKVGEKLLEHGTALQGLLGLIMPVFNEILDLTAPGVKKVVGLRKEIEGIQQKSRAGYIKSLISAGATPEGAVQILLQESALEHEGFFKTGETLCQVLPGLAQSIPSLLAQWAVARSAMAQPKPTETPEA